MKIAMKSTVLASVFMVSLAMIVAPLTLACGDKKPATIKVCDLNDYSVTTIEKDEFDAEKHSKDIENCKKPVASINVCDLKTYKVIAIKENAFDSKLHSKDTQNCKAPIEKCAIEGKQHLPKDSAECVKKPETPKTPETPVVAELPRTGFAAAFAPLMGAGSLVASSYYYVNSLRNRKQ